MPSLYLFHYSFFVVKIILINKSISQKYGDYWWSARRNGQIALSSYLKILRNVMIASCLSCFTRSLRNYHDVLEMSLILWAVTLDHMMSGVALFWCMMWAHVLQDHLYFLHLFCICICNVICCKVICVFFSVLYCISRCNALLHDRMLFHLCCISSCNGMFEQN